MADIKISYLDSHPISSNSLTNTRPTIIFLHGWGLGAEVFTASLEKIAKVFRVVAPDLPGFSASTGNTTQWRYHDYAAILFDFIDALEITKLVIMGQSLAGGIALTMTALKPDFFAGMVLISSTGVPLGSRRSLLPRKGLELLIQGITSKFSKHHLPMVKTSLYNYTFRPINSLMVGNLARQVDLVPILSDILTPTLLLWGKQDMTTYLSSAKILDQNLPFSQLIVVDNAFHEWSILQPDMLAKLVIEHVPKLLERDLS